MRKIHPQRAGNWPENWVSGFDFVRFFQILRRAKMQPIAGKKIGGTSHDRLGHNSEIFSRQPAAARITRQGDGLLTPRSAGFASLGGEKFPTTVRNGQIRPFLAILTPNTTRNTPPTARPARRRLRIAAHGWAVHTTIGRKASKHAPRADCDDVQTQT